MASSLAMTETDAIGRILAARPERFSRLLDDPAKFRVQILLSRPEGGAVVTHGFRVDEEYVYPASTIKLHAAIAALRELRQMQERNDATEPNLLTPMLVRPLFANDVFEGTDASNLDPGHPFTIAHEIRKLCLVSDNPAHNRLYEFLGHRGVHEHIWATGLESLRLHHRLSNHRTPEENLRTARVDFLNRRGVCTIPERTSTLVLEPTTMPGTLVGERHVSGTQTIDAPMDFARKNRVSLMDLHRTILALVLPDRASHGVDLGLHEDDRAFLLHAMMQTPGQSANPVYDPGAYPDHFGKFVLPGVKRVWGEDAIIINKVGQAYGFSIENAFVAHRTSGKWFALTAAIYANSSGTLGADTYDYASVAFPFFVHLGEAVAAGVDERSEPRR